MRKYLPLLGAAMLLCLSSLSFADTKTDDSTNTYTASDQQVEKMHQKPVAEDANSGKDMSTTKEEDPTLNKDKFHQKKKAGAHENADTPK